MNEPGSPAQITFEEIYTRAGNDLGAIPWAALAPQPGLVEWLNGQPPGAGRPALIVACGVGDDAEEVSRRGYTVTAFDLVPAAIGHCRERFPESAADYRVADLFQLPAEWRQAFDLVVEIRTLQSLPLPLRPEAVAIIAGTVRPGGQVFVHGLGRDDDEAPGTRPWPVSHRELSAFRTAGLREQELSDDPRGSSSGRRTLTAIYARP